MRDLLCLHVIEKRSVKSLNRLLLSLFCSLFVLIGYGTALAAPESANAIASYKGEDPTYIYMDFMDSGEMAARLQKSELLRLLMDVEPEFGMIRDMLRSFPAQDMALMFWGDNSSGVKFQMAWRCGDDQKMLLSRIAGKAATANEVKSLFGGAKIGRKSLEIITPEENEEPYYELEPFDLYFTAHNNLLIFGDSVETVKESVSASGNRFKRFVPKKESKGGRNGLMFSLGRELTADVFRTASYMIQTDEDGLPKERLNFEGDVRFVPGGWDLDIYTNAVSLFYGKEFEDSMYAKPEGSFFSAGGGDLLFALDSTPNIRQLFSSSSYQRLLMSTSSDAFGKLPDVLDLVVGEKQRAELLDSLLSIDRLNFAVTNNPAKPKDIRAYALVSSRTPGKLGRAGEIIAQMAEVYNASPKADVKLEEITVDGWKSAYTLNAPKVDKETGMPVVATFAFDDDRMLAGILAPSLIGTPFAAKSPFYAELKDRSDLMETIYVDMRGVRRLVRTFAGEERLGRKNRQMLGVFMIPFRIMLE